MVLAAHCALRLPWTHLAITLLPAKGVVMWFPTTTNYMYMMSLQSPVRQVHLGVQVEMGSNVTSNHSHTCPAGSKLGLGQASSF